MRIKGKGAPDADAPWNEVVPGLWMGGHLFRDAAGVRTAAVVAREFDLVVSLYRRDGHGPAPGVDHHCAEMPDGPLTPEQIATVCALADVVTAAVHDRRRVLVRCHSGYNRSGLVVVQTLINLGHRTDDAIFLVRHRRSRWALNNPLFVDYLTHGLDVARLLTGLAALDG
ncbi:hypothetical protein [Spirillospora sp. NPDC047279]|uniref:protein-tyrosine phosphatase family protein n=1 Tax=Spirillospora sp. NPDC047279 TaxID=3155478 RepID=UPI0033EF21F9